MVSPSKIYTSNIMQTEQVICSYIYIHMYIHMHIIRIIAKGGNEFEIVFKFMVV